MKEKREKSNNTSCCKVSDLKNNSTVLKGIKGMTENTIEEEQHI